jgi:hypothetical protein
MKRRKAVRANLGFNVEIGLPVNADLNFIAGNDDYAVGGWLRS